MEQPDKLAQDCVLHICIVGGLAKETQSRNLQLTRLDKIINDTVKILSKHMNLLNINSDKEPILRFVTAAQFIDDQLVEVIQLKYPEYRFICVANHYDESFHTALNERLTVLCENTEVTSTSTGLINSWICDQADYVIILEDEQSPKYQELIKYCRYVGVPSVTIYSSPNRHILWSASAAYDSYDNDKLEAYLELLLKIEETISNPKEKKQLPFHSPLWGKLYHKYLKKHKDKTGTVTVDNLVTEMGNLEDISEEAEETRSKLYRLYHFYDQQAITYSDNYHSSIYLRAVIPLVVTIVLAVGFYVERLFGNWKLPIRGYLPMLSIIAGIGFFLHALLNLYIYVLSENKIIQSWQKNFIDNRFIAEALRLAVHLMPFGIPVNYQVPANKYGAKSKNNLNSVRKLKVMLKDVGMPGTKHNNASMTACMDYLEELLNDQLNYHKRSANQYARIYEKLKKYGKIIFYIGFIFVLCRGLLQLYISFRPIPERDFVKACANALALIFPVWAAYFTSKLTLCNFEGLYNNHRNMIDEIHVLKQKVNDEQQKDHISYADLYYLSRDITAVILGDVNEWYSQVNARKVTRL